jgi:hypothetical protein
MQPPPSFRAAGFDPRAIDLVLLNDGSINAFVAGGQAIYIHSGLIGAADNVNELQGVIAHELGHITGGHIIRFDEGMKPATGITVLSLLLGGLAAAAGSPDAAMGVFMAGQQAAMGKFLAFSRAQESSADAAGAEFPVKGRAFRARIDRVLQEAAKPGIPLWLQCQRQSGRGILPYAPDDLGSPCNLARRVRTRSCMEHATTSRICRRGSSG